MQESDAERSKSRQKMMRDLGLFSVIVGEMVAFTAVGIGSGWWLWKKLDFPWWAILFTTGASLVLAMMRIYRISGGSSRKKGEG